MDGWGQILVAALPAAATLGVAIFALIGKKQELAKPDWSSYTKELRGDLAELRKDNDLKDDKIDELYSRIGEWRDKYLATQTQVQRLLNYIRRLMRWIHNPQGRPMPIPPPEFHEQLEWSDCDLP